MQVKAASLIYCLEKWSYIAPFYVRQGGCVTYTQYPLLVRSTLKLRWKMVQENRFNEYYGDKDKFIQDLEGCVTSADTSLRIVDIYWHVPLLGDNVSLLKISPIFNCTCLHN